MKTLSQKYASGIYNQVKTIVGSSEADDYRSMSQGLPVLVRQAGLLQALVFLYTRGEAGHKTLLKHLATTLEKKNEEDLLKSCREAASLSDYMWLTRQAMAALEWYKRFADALLPKDGKNV